MDAKPIDAYKITSHAAWEMERRGIDGATVDEVLSAPEQRIPMRQGREVLQSCMKLGRKMYLVRAVVDTDREPAELVTVYRTSKIDKYWRETP